MNRLIILLLVVVLIAVIGVSGVATADHQTLVGSAEDVSDLLNKGLYERAEMAARAHVEKRSANSGTDSPELAASLDDLVAALVLNGKGTSLETFELAERAVRVREMRLGRTSPGLVRSLLNFSDVLVAAGEYKRAIETSNRALGLISNPVVYGDLALADTFDRLGAALTAADRNDEALAALERSLQIKEKMLPPSDTQIARTLEAIGWAWQRKGDYERSREPIRRASTMQESADPSHPAYAQTLNLLGLQYWYDGNLQEALNVASRAVAVAEQTLRPDHPTIARALKYQAGALLYLGDLGQAHALFERALGIAERTYGPAHYENYNYLNDLALSELFLARYTEARRLFERALKLTEAKLGQWNERAATTEGNLAFVDARLGDYEAAQREQRLAMSIWERVLGPDHVYVAQSLSDLAEVYREQNAPARALPLLRRALAIRQKAMAADHRDVATTEADLAATLLQLNRVNEASTIAARAVQTWERADSPGAPEFARVLGLSARIHAALGEPALARQDYERALAIQEKALGRSHPAFADTQVGLAETLAMLGDRPAAVAAAVQGETTGRNHLRLMLRYLPERQSLAYAATRPRGLDLSLSLAVADREQAGEVYDALVKSRGLVLDEMAARHRLTAVPALDVAPLWGALISARQRLANLVVRGPLDQDPALYLKLVDEARREKELAERALAEKSATFREEQKREEVGVEDVRIALPTRSALVAFARYDRTVIQQASPTTKSTSGAPRTVPSYVAFVLRADRSDVTMVPLGTAATIDRLVASWRHETTGVLRTASTVAAEKAYRTAGAALFQTIWRPIATHVADAATIFIVPDGSLNLVSFATLPVGQARYLIDSGQIIHYLSAERDVVANTPTARAARGLLALGGVAFDDATVFSRGRPGAARTGAPRPEAGRLRGACGDLGTLQFSKLTATLEEVRDVRSLWIGPPVTVLDGVNASERAFKQSAPGRRVLHLATHGFFLGDQCDPAPGTPRAAATSGTPSPARVSPGTADNPLLLSGLALAGANRRADAGPGDEDGILTAEEVTSLNLDGVEWAVLSACDTGLGQVKVGEGVFGLRRAFQVAGVHTVIMSLWAVEDESTREWMTALYDGRLKKNLTTAEAVHRATLTVLRDRRAAGQSTHPFYWGGFVAAGDWR